MQYNRLVFDENIGFSSVIDEKFKTNSLVIRFIKPLNKDEASENALAIGVLSDSSKSYATLAKLNEKLSSLYGASISSAAKKRGDVQILSIGASWINNQYAIDGEDITGEMLDILCGCLFEPNASGGKFNEESFGIVKKDLLDKIDAEINNKRGYAISKAFETAFKGEPAEISCYGSKESAEKVTSEGAYNAYRNLLETAQVEIFYVAPEENCSVTERLKEEFSKICRQSVSVDFNSYSPVKETVERVSEEFVVNQSKMVITFKTDSDDVYAIKLMSMIFGETPVSKLFMNVREKMSLCYYCASRMVFSKGAIMVDSGVEKENIDKAEVEILHQLDEMKDGNFSEDELNNVLLSLENSLTAIGDTPSSYSLWYFDRLCTGSIMTPDEMLAQYKAVTRERIIEAAKSMKLDSVYLMLNKEVQE